MVVNAVIQDNVVLNYGMTDFDIIDSDAIYPHFLCINFDKMYSIALIISANENSEERTHVITQSKEIYN